ncbi:response regulator [Pontiella sp.]|uniref:hybrid sensor histidine kinase/response regulator n=1 Tax=Pontiella sp. TaxID=2837462 RepID=UPI003564D70B
MKSTTYRMRRLSAVMAAAACLGLCAVRPALGVKQKTNLLLISSYHPNFPTFYQQIDGLRDVLPAERYNLDVEFMDSKRFPDAAAAALFGQYLEDKLSRLAPYDLVFTADDNALRFVLGRRDTLLAGMPLVFFGVNDLPLAARLDADPQITGVVEAASIRESIELARRLCPKVKKIYAVSDATTSGMADLQSYYNAQASLPDLALLSFSMGETTWDGLADALAALPSDSVVLLLSAYHDAVHVPKTFSDSLDLILEHSAVPVFHLWEHGLGDGIVGGEVIDHFEQGQTAARLAQRLLTAPGQPAEPVVLSSPNRSVVDYRALKAWGIDPSRIPNGVEVRNRPPSFYGNHRRLFWSFLSLFLLMGAFILALGFTMMARRRVERKLQQSEQLFKALFNELLQFCALLDPSGRIIRINDSALKTRDLQPADVVDSYFWDAPWWKDSGFELRVKDAVRRAAAGETVRFLIARNDPHLGEVAIDFSVKPILEGDETLLLAEGRDITELHQMQERLLQKDKMDAIGQLAGGVAHDFNNMLGGIMGFGELLEIELPADRPELKDYAHRIVSSCRRAALLTEQLLAFARKGKQQTVVVDLRRVCGDAVLLLERSIDKKISIVRSFPDESLLILGDPGQLQSAVLNLGLNARDAMPAGGTLRIALRRKSIDAAYCSGSRFALLPGDYVEIEVSDTGHGIPPDQLERIFEPFFTTKEVGKGTGLGLAAVYGAVKEHHGELSVVSEVGKGTEIRLLLPSAKASVQEALVPVPQQPAARDNRTILVVDDESEFRALLEAALNNLGYQVITAANGRIGMELYEQHEGEIDLSIVDAVMPELNGMDMLLQIRRRNPEAKVVITSGYSADSSRSDFLEAGASAFLAKPYSITELGRVLFRQLDRASQG